MSDIELPDLSRLSVNNNNSSVHLVSVTEADGNGDVINANAASNTVHSNGNDSGNHSMSTNASRK